MNKILAIESSCDETSAAVISISSQTFHTIFGGVVPELASRAHLQTISPIVNEALKKAEISISEIDAFAVTSEPGLIGSLIVGSNFAKGLSIRYNKPVIPVNHIEGHIYSGSLEDNSLEFPYISMVVSGGHTSIFYVESFNNYKVIGSTKDDASGEAFDKIAKLLGLGYPGGPVIDKLAKSGNKSAYNFPRPMINEPNYDFSFSGLKTSVRYFIHKQFPDGVPQDILPDICASAQEAIVDVLVHKAIKATLDYKAKSVIIAGGVSANSRLREKLKERCSELSLKFVAPKMSYCLDNAAMIAFVAAQKLKEANNQSFFDLTYKVSPSALRANR